MAIELGVNPNTISKAYQEAETRGLTYSQAGKGHFISEKSNNLNPLINPIYKDLDHLVHQLLQLGQSIEDITQHIQKEIL